MKNVEDGPIYSGRIKIRKREDIKEEKTAKMDKKLIDSKANLPEGHIDFNEMYKDLANLQIKMDSFNKEAKELLKRNNEEIKLIYDKWQMKYKEISEKFNDTTKELLNEFDTRRKELEKFVEEKDISKYTEKMKNLYEEMQGKWEEHKKEYYENEEKAKEQEEKEIKKKNKEYNSKLIELKEKYNLNNT